MYGSMVASGVTDRAEEASAGNYNHHDIGEEVAWRPPLLYANLSGHCVHVLQKDVWAWWVVCNGTCLSNAQATISSNNTIYKKRG